MNIISTRAWVFQVRGRTIIFTLNKVDAPPSPEPLYMGTVQSIITASNQLEDRTSVQELHVTDGQASGYILLHGTRYAMSATFLPDDSIHVTISAGWFIHLDFEGTLVREGHNV